MRLFALARLRRVRQDSLSISRLRTISARCIKGLLGSVASSVQEVAIP